jgi:Uma2 family endonuclease
MSAATAEKRTWTVAEYLAMEDQSGEKHEYFDGEVFLMAGAGYEHSLVVAGLVVALGQALGERCVVLPSDQRLFVSATGLYSYADASVVCGQPDLTNDPIPSLRNPQAIFEVLSTTTESYDRGKKFSQYRTIASFTDYVLLAQDQVMIEHYRRQLDGSWRYQELREGTVALACGALPVHAVYKQWQSRKAITG